MKNPLRHHARSTKVQAPKVPDTPAELLDDGIPMAMADPGSLRLPGRLGHPSPNEREHAWKHMQQDVDPDCARDPGSDLAADWDLEAAALGGHRVAG